MKNYICIDGEKTKLDPDLSMETAKNKLKKFLGKCKPKELRHGDYGHYESGGLWWAWQRKDTLELFGENKGTGCAAQDAHPDMIRDDNSVDDLKRNAEDLEKFTTQCSGCRDRDTFYAQLENNNKMIAFQVMGSNKAYDWCHCTLDEATEIHQKLGQLISTAFRHSQKDC